MEGERGNSRSLGSRTGSQTALKPPEAMRAGPAGGLCPAHATKPKPFAVAPTDPRRRKKKKVINTVQDSVCGAPGRPLRVDLTLCCSTQVCSWGCQLGLHFRISWESLVVKFRCPGVRPTYRLCSLGKGHSWNHSHYASAGQACRELPKTHRHTGGDHCTRETYSEQISSDLGPVAG